MEVRNQRPSDSLGPPLHVDIVDCEISRNGAYRGGAIYVRYGVTMRIENSVFRKNVARHGHDGGAIAFGDPGGNSNSAMDTAPSELTIANTLFEENECESGVGGAIWCAAALKNHGSVGGVDFLSLPLSLPPSLSWQDRFNRRPLAREGYALPQQHRQRIPPHLDTGTGILSPALGAGVLAAKRRVPS